MRKGVVIFCISFFASFLGSSQVSKPHEQIQIPLDSFKFDFRESINVQELNQIEITRLNSMPIFKPEVNDPMVFKVDSSMYYHLRIKSVGTKPPEFDSLESKEDY